MPKKYVDTGWFLKRWVSDTVIADAPTADVVEVVRCKNCVFLSKNMYCWANNRFVATHDDFCSVGKRRYDENIH